MRLFLLEYRGGRLELTKATIPSVALADDVSSLPMATMEQLACLQRLMSYPHELHRPLKLNSMPSLMAVPDRRPGETRRGKRATTADGSDSELVFQQALVRSNQQK